MVAGLTASPGDSIANWSDSGPLAWVGFDGDPETIEAVSYIDKRTDEHLRRRVVRRDPETGSQGWATCKLHLALEAEEAVGGDYSEIDYSPGDYFTG